MPAFVADARRPRRTAAAGGTAAGARIRAPGPAEPRRRPTPWRRRAGRAVGVGRIWPSRRRSWWRPRCLLFPAMENSRFNARVAACQDNLRLLGQALAQYSERYQRLLPAGSPGGPTGRCRRVRAGAGQRGLPRKPAVARLPCFVRWPTSRSSAMPSLDELSADRRPGEAASACSSRMGGSYGY